MCFEHSVANEWGNVERSSELQRGKSERDTGVGERFPRSSITTIDYSHHPMLTLLANYDFVHLRLGWWVLNRNTRKVFERPLGRLICNVDNLA